MNKCLQNTLHFDIVDGYPGHIAARLIQEPKETGSNMRMYKHREVVYGFQTMGYPPYYMSTTHLGRYVLQFMHVSLREM